jgi:hypothetical protein
MESNSFPYSALTRRRLSRISSRVLVMSFSDYESRRIQFNKSKNIAESPVNTRLADYSDNRQVDLAVQRIYGQARRFCEHALSSR